VVGLGASAGLYYPAVAELIRTTCVVPADADVANAIGAVVGQVRTHVDVYVSQPERGRFRVHHPQTAHDFIDLDAALDEARNLARTDAQRSALAAGAEQVEVVISRALNVVPMEGEQFFVDATVTASASGRPAIAR
jgi:N-methylhydantoinase A/oxoprolinase/acetone carboxylase beta subunit